MAIISNSMPRTSERDERDDVVDPTDDARELGRGCTEQRDLESCSVSYGNGKKGVAF